MADVLSEKWMKGVAVTTTCLAVMTSIAAARGAACGAKTQFLNTTETSQWAHYQAKSIKENLAEVQKNAFEVESLGAANAAQRALYEKKLDAITQDVARYDKEKNQIKQQAEETGTLNRLLTKKGNFFSGAVVFFQIGIMLSSVSALLKKRSMWVVGLAFGALAAGLLGYGLLLQPLLF